MHHGYLSDMAPDGYGYILDLKSNSSHVFAPRHLYPPPADWTSLEGRHVRFTLWEDRVSRVELI